LSDQTHRTEFERGGVWRRGLALLIDAIAISAVLQLLAMALFPLSHGRLQFAAGPLYGITCDKLEKLPEGVSVPAGFEVNSITDCRQSVFGLTSSRVLSITKASQGAAIQTSGQIFQMLDADGKPFVGLTLEVLFLPLLVGLRYAFDRARGSPGRRLCRIRLASAVDTDRPSPALLAWRYLAWAAPLALIQAWQSYAALFVAPGVQSTNLFGLLIQVSVGIPALIAVPEALYATFWRKDAWYDRFAGTSVLRVGKQGAFLPIDSAPRPPDPIESDLSRTVQTEFAAGASFSAASGALPPPLPPRGWQNYFARHWRGELSLPVSYWVNGALGGLIAGFFVIAVGAVTHRQGEAQPLLWLTSLCATWLFIVASAIWQLVGIWRSATHYQQSGRRFWGGAAKVLMVLGGLQVAISFFTVATPQIAGIFEIVTGDSRVGPHRFRVLAYGETLEFSGGITFGVAKEMEGFLNAMTNVKTVRLNSIGGRILEAQRMADVIKARRLATFVEKDCLSACTIVFLGGADRAVMPTARLGFHQPAFRGMTAADRSIAIANEERRLQGFGLSRDFAQRANRAEPNSMWFPDKDELLRERVVTRVVLVKPNQPPPAPPAPPVPSPVEAAAPASGAVANAVAAAPVAAREPKIFPAARPDLNAPLIPRAAIPPDVIKRLTASPKPKSARPGPARPGPARPAGASAPSPTTEITR
jgi:hypothetical protein